MRVLFLAPANSIHTKRWVISLAERGIKVLLVSQHPQPDGEGYGTIECIKLPFNGTKGYFLNAIPLRQILRKFKPDLLNVHYASGYGTTSALVGFQPTLLSVWGSDVFEFPHESWFKGLLLRWNLRRATNIASTSKIMAKQVNLLVPDIKNIAITPFGVNQKKFYPIPRVFKSDLITIGTVKSLDHVYGIDILLSAFSSLINDSDLNISGLAQSLRLVLVGDGPDKSKLQDQVNSLGLEGVVTFVGAVPHNDVPGWLNKLDVYVAMSREESFGVAVIEASSCGLSVVVSDAGGLPEVVINNETGLIVPRNEVHELYCALKKLVLDEALRKTMGKAGVEFIKKNYEWEHCIDIMVMCYKSIINKYTPGKRG